jgi:hypothetical protein
MLTGPVMAGTQGDAELLAQMQPEVQRLQQQAQTANTQWLIASFGESQPGPSSPAPEGAELRTALSVLLLAFLEELLHARQPLLVLYDLLTGLALPRLTLGGLCVIFGGRGP